VTPELTYAGAIRDAFAVSLRRDPSVFLMGLGVPDPKGFFGTTIDLEAEFGASRVMDMPCSENGMTGVMIGAALNGMRPVLSHQRLDFALLSMDQLCTQAAKWHYMFGGQMKVPLVVRMILGRGWGQGPQHSQCLHSWFAHIPGLKVLMPATPYDAKGMLISAIEDDDPVVFIEHRWLHHVMGAVPEGHYTVPIGTARVAHAGSAVTIVALSCMVPEAIEAARRLETLGVSAEVIDLRSVSPIDRRSIIDSVKKTGRLVVADTGWATAGISAEIVTLACESAFSSLKAAPERVCFPDCPTPTSPSLAAAFYPRAGHIVAAARKVLAMPANESDLASVPGLELDKPTATFTGPF
jgi:pyruvate/2-oxoglutarate/acetoin dehydrogenase E1 component